MFGDAVRDILDSRLRGEVDKQSSPECCYLTGKEVRLIKLFFPEGLTKILGKCIRISVDVQQLRQRLGMSRDALARELGVTYKTIYLWEKGKAKPSPMAQQKLEELEKQKK